MQGGDSQSDDSTSTPPRIPPRSSMDPLLVANEVSAASSGCDASGTQDFISFSVLCMHDFESDEAGLLPFRKGEILDVIKCDESGWWAAMRQSKSKASRIGWIPQAYVSVLSEEMVNKLRNVETQFRLKEYDADTKMYNGSSPLTDDSPSPSPIDDEDPCSKLFSSISLDHCSSPDRLASGMDNEHPLSYPATHGSPPVSFPISAPRLPSRSVSYRQTWKSQSTASDSETRSRSSSLKSTRNSRRAVVQAAETLGRLTNRTENPKPKELTRMPSRKFSGRLEPLYKGVDDKLRRKANEDNSQHEITRTSMPLSSRPLQNCGVAEDDRGRVRSGSLSALVEKLTSEPDLIEKPEGRTFTDIFLMTFRTFTTANILFDMLLDRYHMPPPSNLSDAACNEWIIRVRLPLRLRVLEVFNTWLQDHRLGVEEPRITRRLSQFLTDLDDQALGSTAERILNRLRCTIPNKPTTTTSAGRARKSKAHKNELLKMDPIDMAEQLTLLEFGLYVKITPQECLAYARTQSGSAVANLLEFCGTHDKLASWVKASVLNNHTLSKRSDTIEFWIRVAEKCRLLNNFSSMSAIVTALDAAVLTRLHLTWSHVGKRSTLDTLLRYNEPTGQFAGYRTLLQQAEGLCVPFIIMYLTDIVRINEHCKEEGDTILFFQRVRWYEIITTMLKFQSRPYRIAPSEATAAYIEMHCREVVRDEEWFWQRSQELQDSENASADIRKGLEAAGF